MKNKAMSRKLFFEINGVFLFLLAALCVLPIIHIFSLSLSSAFAVSARLVYLWPVQFTFASYRYVLEKTEFWSSFAFSIERIFFGGAITIPMTILSAYPLSKESSKFKTRTFYSWIFVFTMLFYGGLIPTFMVVKSLGLLDTIWALVLPPAVQVFYVVLLLNFFRDIPKELEEASFIDGAGQWAILWKIYVPISKPALATIALFTIVGHWNEWFGGLLYMNPRHYPLQSYLQTIIVQTTLENSADLSKMREMVLLNNQTFKAAQIFIAIIPILCVYPMLQKYFTKGIILGSVKG